MSGFVSFVSSGPGDPELLTVRGVDRIKRADAILYDDLSAGPILDLARAEADLVGVGKRAGQPSPRQDHVNRLLVDYAAGGARVVRLKSGDAGIFGRLEEEIMALRAAGIAHEVIPGVSAASAAAAAADISLTRRVTARRMQFVTGHDATGTLPEGLNMAALADPGVVTAVYMGRRTFATLADRLMAAGLAPGTPALLAEAVSTPEQHMVFTTLSGLRDRLCCEPSGRAPVLILYGPLGEPGPEVTR
ncbi:MAG: uroporphyrinogen-III C-methyltransferase [Hyphomicrobiaceae bacterium]